MRTIRQVPSGSEERLWGRKEGKAKAAGLLGWVCVWPAKPLSPGLVPCDSAGINTCPTRFLQSIHKDLEAKIARFHQREDAILYPSCFDANAGLFEVCGAVGGSW